MSFKTAMTENYLELIKKIDLFNGLDEKTLSELVASFSLVELPENEMLFLQGDASDALYILLSGYLLATLETEEGHLDVLGKIIPGEVVGEMGLLTKKPRTLSIKALSSSRLLRLSEENFMKFITLNPSVTYKILLNTISRGQDTIYALSHKQKHRHVLLIPASANAQETSMCFFIKHLKKHISSKKTMIFLEGEKLHKIYSELGLKDLVNYLDNLEKTHSTIVYYLENQEPTITKLLLERASKISFIGLGDAKPELSQFSAEIFEKKQTEHIHKNLILLWKKNFPIKNTRFWLEKGNFNLHNHLFLEEDTSYERLLRFFAGKAVGLVLSGGGFRCFSHLGVINALTEKNIPIDAIGGTSVGAATAAFYLISQNQEELKNHVETASDAMRKTLAWKALTLPIISIYSTFHATHHTKSVFHNKRLEDLPIPFFAISCNISNNTEVVHRIGKISRAVRASAAIPGLFPPIVEKGQLLYDGGLVNNLPTDQMRNLLGENATIIASDLGTIAEDNTYYIFPPILPPLKLLLLKLGIKKQHYVFPPLFNTIVKSMLSGSIPRYKNNIKIADYYIHPDFSHYDLLIIEKSLQENMIELGYKDALAILKDWHYDSDV